MATPAIRVSNISTFPGEYSIFLKADEPFIESSFNPLKSYSQFEGFAAKSSEVSHSVSQSHSQVNLASILVTVVGKFSKGISVAGASAPENSLMVGVE